MPGCTSIYGYRRSPTLTDYPGCLAALFFTSGCNLCCRYCHNAALLARHKEGLSWERLRLATARFQGQWVNGAVLSGGEPTLAGDLPRLLDTFRGLGWAVKLDTNGSRPDVLRANLDKVDYVAMDVKASLARYPELTGLRETACIRESIDLLQTASIGVEFRMTLVEPFHDEHELHAMGELVRGARPVYLQAFVPRDDIPYSPWRTLPRTSPAYLEHACTLLRAYAPAVTIRGG